MVPTINTTPSGPILFSPKLNLGENNIGPEGVVLMVGALKNNFKLTKIIIDGANNTKITKIINRNKKIFEGRRFKYTKYI
jgi:hypothetical protein